MEISAKRILFKNFLTVWNDEFQKVPAILKYIATYTEITEKLEDFNPLTIDELNNGDYPNKVKILKLISKITVLPFDNEIINIAQVYLNNYLMPNDLKGDALHLAYASFYKIDFLLTWNCNHLANANKKQHIRVINTKLGLFTPEIITPMLLFTEDKNV